MLLMYLLVVNAFKFMITWHWFVLICYFAICLCQTETQKFIRDIDLHNKYLYLRIFSKLFRNFYKEVGKYLTLL